MRKSVLDRRFLREIKLLPTLVSHGVKDGLGNKANEFGAIDRCHCDDSVIDLSRPNTKWVDEVHRDLHLIADLQAKRSNAWAADR